MDNPPVAFAQHLRSLRERQGLSVRALAELVGVSKVTIWNWERGHSEPRARLMSPLAKALDVAPVQLRGPGSVKPQSEPGEVISQSQGQEEPRVHTQAEVLSEVIASAKQIIAEASGVSPKNITISIDF